MQPRYKMLFMFFSFMLMLILISNVFAYSTNNYKPKYGAITENANFRYTPSLSSKTIVKTLKKSTIVKIVGEINNFYITQLGDNQIGLVSKDYVKSSNYAPSGSKVYTNYKKYYATTNIAFTNLRAGPSTNFKVRASLSKDINVEIIGEIGDFYTVVTKNNYVGMIRKDLITKISSQNTKINTTTNTSSSKANITTSKNLTPGAKGTSNEEYVLKLINQARINKNLKALTMDSNLLRIAQIKSKDMVNSNYFSHISPTYGSPFNMMKNNGIIYKIAGENIAGNSSLDDAVNSWIESPTHSKNIFSTNYNYIGIGVANSKIYGYIISAMFIEK